MKIVAVDQSYTSCGLMFFEDGKLQYAKRVVSTKDDQEDIFDRAWQITTAVAKYAHEHEAEMVVLEGLAFSKMGNATRDLAGLQFSIITYLKYVCCFNTMIIPPNTVKKTATGKGNAKKEEMYETLPSDVKKLLEDMKLKKTTGRYDLTDAYWIGISAQNILAEQKAKQSAMIAG